MSFPAFEELKKKAERYGITPIRCRLGVIEDPIDKIFVPSPSPSPGEPSQCCGLGIALLGTEVVDGGRLAEVIFHEPSLFLDGYVEGFDGWPSRPLQHYGSISAWALPSSTYYSTISAWAERYIAGYERGKADALAFGL